jgi:hypothetical protein
MVKINKPSVGTVKPPLSPTVSAVLSDFVSKLGEEKALDEDALNRLKKALLDNQSTDVASLSAAIFGDGEN